jgi:predicted phosphodiesterase
MFGRRVDVVVFGGTHAPLVEQDGDVLLVNPGSPSLAAQLTVAELVVGDGPPSARIIGVPA